MSQYIRLKRKNQTIFLHVEPSNNFGQIKQRIAEILSIPDPNKILLLGPDKVLILMKVFNTKTLLKNCQ
jgi:hypothetical protein